MDLWVVFWNLLILFGAGHDLIFFVLSHLHGHRYYFGPLNWILTCWTSTFII